MLTPRFHCPQAVEGLAHGTRIDLPATAAHHALRVLRLADGAPVAVFSGRGGEYEAVLDAPRGAPAQARLTRFHALDRAPAIDVHIQQALVASEKMDWVIEKAVELGARSVTPVQVERSVVRLSGERAARRLAHWQALAISASEQCGLNWLLEVRPVLSLQAACAASVAGAAPIDGDIPVVAAALRCRLDPQGLTSLTGWLLAGVAECASAGGRPSVTLLVGPEGGFSGTETTLIDAHGYRPVTLGPRVLRTETAALAALAALRAIADDFAAAVLPNPLRPATQAHPQPGTPSQ